MDPLAFKKYPQQPHGGELVNQVVPAEKREAMLAKARELPTIRIDLEASITIEMIATGVLSPNKGFMNEADYKSVLKEGRLSNGLVWPVPLSFAPIGERNREVIKTLSVGNEVALTDGGEEPDRHPANRGHLRLRQRRTGAPSVRHHRSQPSRGRFHLPPHG